MSSKLSKKLSKKMKEMTAVLERNFHFLNPAETHPQIAREKKPRSDR